MNSKVKILYVDDELINLKIFEINFNKKYDVITAENGVKGLEKLRDNPDTRIVISDMKMPIMDGPEFVSKVKEKKPEVACYILTGFDANEKTTELIKSGIILEHFTKPISISEITDSIDKALNV